jgi:hypothetical protein
MADVRDRIIAHRDAPEIYDAPSYEQMATRILQLERSLRDIRSIAIERKCELFGLLANRGLEEY